jgi:hypothetical protein
MTDVPYSQTQVYTRRKDDREEIGIVANGQFYAFGFVSGPQFDLDAADHADAQRTADSSPPGSVG